MPQSVTNPGAAATSALFEFLADRNAQERQAMLDNITKSTATRQMKSPAPSLTFSVNRWKGSGSIPRIREDAVGGLQVAEIGFKVLWHVIKNGRAERL
jgi:hypothetical protein